MTFYLTTPIYYPNARPHVGSAYTTIACDAIARYKRMCGYDVAFLTGTDEHGEKLQRAAEAAGMAPEKFVAEKRKLFKELWKTLGIGPFRDTAPPEDDVEASLSHQENGDDSAPGAAPPIDYRFVHTSQNPAHKKAVHWMIEQAKKYPLPYCARCDKYLEHGTRPATCSTCGGPVEHRRAIFSKRYEGRYCIHDEMYVSEGAEPVNCPNCGRPTELISEDNYFFRLSAFQERLLKHYEDHPEFVQPDFRMNEVKSFVKGGKDLVKGSLRDISVSRRRISWGIPWPGDPEQVVYVWYDALTSYLTGIGFEGDKRSKDFEKYWMGAEGPSKVVHMIGKDILRFHAVYWPAFLWAAGLPLPKTIFAHGWIYYEQDKMSKSKGNVVYPETVVKAFNEFGAPGNDALRYYLLRDTPFGLDGNFSYDGLVQRYNSDLANDLGNLASRTITMIHRYCDAVVPEPSGPLTALEAELKLDFFRSSYDEGAKVREASGYVEPIRQELDKFALNAAAFDLLTLISAVNGYLVKREPWKLAEFNAGQDRETLALALYTAADLLRTITVLLYPIAPASAARLWQQLGCEGRIEDQKLDDLKWGQLKPGTKVGKPEPIFPRLDKAKTLAKLHELAEEDRAAEQNLKESKVESEQKPGAPPADGQVPITDQKSQITNQQSSIANADAPKITIGDFAKIDLRVGTVLSAEPIPGATKLLKLQVDIGSEVRQVCAGIAEYYKPEDIVGMKIVLVANLAPRKLRGVESNGMIVAASVGEHGRPVLATFKEDVPNGARLK
ncbi:MAG TPA: methionine--tRNA ligase subunit beta [Terriglobia bacterium]|nr:methionine--tRNA ligase subunit beta [Terriglobia bacterium]